MWSLGLFGQLCFTIIQEMCGQVQINYGTNDEYQWFLAFVQLVRVACRLANMAVLKHVSHEERMKLCSILIFASYGIFAFLFVSFDLNTGESKVVLVLSALSLLFSAVAAALSESTIVGYLGKCF